MGKAENDPLGVLDTPGDLSPVISLPPQGIKEHRNEARYRAPWRAAIAIQGQDFIYGRIRDISLHGTAILNGFNLNPGTSVTLNIHVPTLATPCAPKVLVIYGTTSYSIHDADHLCFRIGITFVKFELDTDRVYLEERLTNHHIKMPDYVCQRSSDAPISRFSSG